MTNRDQDLIERLTLPVSESMFVRKSDMLRTLFAERSEAATAIASSATRIAELEARLEAAPSPSPAPVVTFEQWWKASKYRQVIYAGASEQQIARDGWNAALATLSQPAKGEREGGGA